MGCDIHMVLERKSRDPDMSTWIGLHAFPYLGKSVRAYGPSVDGVDLHYSWRADDRDYALFGELAGVRCEPPSGQHREPNGFPSDASELAVFKKEKWGDDGHSHSHLPAAVFAERWLIAHEKIVELAADKLEGSCKLVTDTVREILYPAFDSPDELNDFRVVFWFDN